MEREGVILGMNVWRLIITVLDGRGGATSCKVKGRFLLPDLYYRISYCAAASLLLGQFLEAARRLGHACSL